MIILDLYIIELLVRCSFGGKNALKVPNRINFILNLSLTPSLPYIMHAIRQGKIRFFFMLL